MRRVCGTSFGVADRYDVKKWCRPFATVWVVGFALAIPC